MQIRYTDKRTWSLLDDQGKPIASLIRPKWYSNRAELIHAGGVHELKPLKRWSSAIGLFAGNVPLMEARFEWSSIVLRAKNGHPRLRVKRKNWWSNAYVFIDEQGVERMSMRVRFLWRSFERVYAITGQQGDALSPEDVLFGLHAIMVSQDRAAAAG